MNNRYLIVEIGCPRCREFLKAVSLVNMKLPPEKKIQIVEQWAWENFGTQLFEIAEKFNQEGLSGGYPFCYIDGIIVEPTNRHLLREYLNKLLEEDFITHEL